MRLATCSRRIAPTWSAYARARPSRCTNRVHGRRQVDARRRTCGAARTPVRRRRPRDRAGGADQADLRDRRRGGVPAARVEARARRARLGDARCDRARRRRRRHRPDPKGAAQPGRDGPGRNRGRGSVAPRRGRRAAARAGRGGLPNALRAATAALRRRGRCPRERSRRRRARRRRCSRRGRRARAARRPRSRQRPDRDRQRRARGRHLRHGRPARARRTRARRPRACAGRAGKDRRVAGGALALAAARALGHARGARRRLHHGRCRLCRRDLLPRDRLGCRADDARRPGRRGDRGQDRDRPPGREEPRRRLPLAGRGR